MYNRLLISDTIQFSVEETLATFDQNGPQETLINGEAAKGHKHLIQWLSDIIKKEKGVPHMLAPRRRCLNYSKVY